ncbi:hypothetical protein HUJ04_000071 [Dendroctonus ponderosae]|nr:hypothetical protein HUJ04_000071 [Dendroctonus ponderosae]
MPVASVGAGSCSLQQQNVWTSERHWVIDGVATAPPAQAGGSGRGNAAPATTS